MKSWSERLLSALLGSFLAGGVMYVSIVGTFVTRDDVSRMIAVESPYVQDAKWIESQMVELSHQMTEINIKLDKLLLRSLEGK